jgi:hypothetical protein
MKLKLTRINNKIVRPLPVMDPEDTRPVLGADLIPEVYANIGIISKKKTGKTTIIGKILDECVGKETKKVLLFASTAYKDSAYKTIRKMLERKGVDVEVHTSLFEDGVNKLDELVAELEAEAEQREQDEADGKVIEVVYNNKEKPDVDKILDKLAKENGINGYIDLEEDEEEKKEAKRKKRRSKYKMSEYVIVIDDLSNECKSPSLARLLKMNRHWKAKIIVSTQWLKDLPPMALKQLDVWIVMRGFNVKQLEKIYSDAQLSCTFPAFVEVYRFATRKKFNFLYIDAQNMTFRQNFNHEIKITGETGENNYSDSETNDSSDSEN